MCELHSFTTRTPATVRRSRRFALLERHGHHLVQVVDEEWSAEQILDKHADLVVAPVATGPSQRQRVLAGRKLPLAILPMGTANNIAKSLCCEDRSRR